MKIFSFICLLALTSLSLQAQEFQKGTLTQTDGTSYSGRIAINNEASSVSLKEGSAPSRTIMFDKISGVTLGDRNYSFKQVEGATLLAHQLVSGKANLHNTGADRYMITSEDKNSPEFSLSEDNNRIAGILSVMFSDCNAIRASLNKIDEFSERNLSALVSEYNRCSYGDYAPSETEIEKASSFNTDKARFYAGINSTFSRVSFSSSDSTKAGNTGFGLHAGVTVSPSFLKSLQGNLHFYLEGHANFYGSTDFSNNNVPTDYKTQTFRVLMGLEYYMNKTGKINPFVGIGIGATSDTFEGSVNGNDFDITGGNTIYVPKIGALLKLNNGKHIGLTVSYVPEYENDLSFPTQSGLIPLVVNTSSISVGLSYSF